MRIQVYIHMLFQQSILDEYEDNSDSDTLSR